MSLIDMIFGARPPKRYALPRIESAPAKANWRSVRWRETNPPVEATLADKNGAVETSGGKLHYRAGEHYIVTGADGSRFTVAREIFERIYERMPDGRYNKKRDVTYRYFTLDHAVQVETLEGAQRAEPGDWIMQGVEGELWPIPAHEAESKYEPA